MTGAQCAGDSAMASEQVNRRIDLVVIPSQGGTYHVRIHAKPRSDGRWDGVVEFEPDAGGESVTTGSETTQRTAEEVFEWSAGLGVAYFEGAFERAWHRMKDPERPRGRVPEPLPANLDARSEIVADRVIEVFRSMGAPRLRTSVLFDHTEYANADLVRAFEVLEQDRRLLVRHSVDGNDWLELTPAGARMLGFSEEEGTTSPADPRHPETRGTR